jgi:hypothetical protein
VHVDVLITVFLFWLEIALPKLPSGEATCHDAKSTRRVKDFYRFRRKCCRKRSSAWFPDLEEHIYWIMPLTGAGVTQSVGLQHLRYGLGNLGTRVLFRAEAEILLFSTASRPALGPTQSPTQWVPEALSPEVKWLVLEAGHSPPCSEEVKNAWNHTSTALYFFMMCFTKHKEKFTFTF